jgi:hypothetical protein
MDRLIDEWLPSYDETEVHSAEMPAPAQAVEAAVRGLTASDLPLTRLLMSARTLPGRLAGRPAIARPGRPLVEGMLAAGFVVLEERPGEQIVLGAVGRFWRVRGDGLDRLDGPEEFRDYDRPASVRAAMDFTIEPVRGGGARLSTETRIAGTDAAGTRTFRRYWRIVHPGSALIRREFLSGVRRRAERA